MFAHGIECERINVNVAVHLFQKTAGSSDFLHDEVADGMDDVSVVGWENAVDGGLSQGDGNEI